MMMFEGDYYHGDIEFPSYEDLAWAFEDMGYMIDEDIYWLIWDLYEGDENIDYDGTV